MSVEERASAGRGRGRPSADSGFDARAAILSAARRHFADAGFAHSTLRAIARDAGVDASLINHHFGDKRSLLVATLDLPVDPSQRLAEALAGPDHELGVRVVRTFVTTWDEHPEVFATVARTALSGDARTSPVLDVIRDVVVSRLRERLGVPEASLGPALAASQLLGLGLLRYVVRLEPLASAPLEEVVALHGPTVQRSLTSP